MSIAPCYFSFSANSIVSIVPVGSNVAGQMYTLQCTVTIVAGVLNITWVNETDRNELNEGNGISFNSETMSPGTVQQYDLIFNPLDYTHIGEYTCQANLTVNKGVVFNGAGSDSYTVSAKSK